MKHDYCVKEIDRKYCDEYILKIHYAKRYPSVTFKYGLFFKGSLCGIITYGSPFSSTLKSGIAGENYSSDVLELNRLCLKNNLKNEASILVGSSLKLLPKNKIIVSFADIEQNHKGIVYQATNFRYYGLSANRKDWKIKGKEHLHSQTIADEFRGFDNRIEMIKQKYGNDFYYKQRSRKHRYIIVIGDKKYKKLIYKIIRYTEKKYPKKISFK